MPQFFMFCQLADEGVDSWRILRSGLADFRSGISAFQAAERLLLPELVITSEGIWIQDAQVDQEGVCRTQGDFVILLM